MNKIESFKLKTNYNNVSFGSAKLIKAASQFISIQSSDYHPFIKQTMMKLANCEIEHGVIFTKDARLIKETIGTVSCPFKSKEEHSKVLNFAAENYPGFIFIHNHPSLDKHRQPLPITLADAFSIGYHDGSEAIVVHSDGTYSSVKCLNNEQKINDYSVDKIRMLIDLIDIGAYNESAWLRNKIWSDNEKDFGIIYTNTFYK